MHPWIVSLAWKATPPQAPPSMSGSRGMEVHSHAFDAVKSMAPPLPVCWLHARQSRKHAVNTLMPLQEDSQQVAKGGPLRASFMVYSRLPQRASWRGCHKHWRTRRSYTRAPVRTVQLISYILACCGTH